MSARRLRVELAPSASLASVLALAHAAAAACLLAVVPGLPGVLLAIAVALLGLASAWSRALLRARASVRAMELGDEAMLLELTDGRRVEAQPSGRRYVSRFLVAIPLRRPMRRTILVTRGMMSPEGFRRLRIWALWGKVSPPVAGRQLAA